MLDTPTGNYRIVLSKNGARFNVCRVFFGADGSFYVTWPYHPDRKALLAKLTVNYAKDIMVIQRQDMIDTGAFEDDNKRLKLSHHPDGFVQFSGEGILSGKDGDNIRGFGVMSWPLAAPANGPAFILVIGRIELFSQTASTDEGSVVFDYDDLTPTPGDDLLVLEGHYFPPPWRRFVQPRPDERRTISVVHPATAVVTMRVLFPPKDCAVQGFIALEMYTMASDTSLQYATISISSSAGNIRANEDGEMLGDEVLCHYPNLEPEVGRSVNYRRHEVRAHGIVG